MTSSYKKKSRGEMIRYTRPNIAEYQNSNGDIMVAPKNALRLAYDTWGHFLGLKFGDGDTATIPASVNTMWRPAAAGCLFVIGQAPQGVVWFKFGNIELTGIDAHKLYIIELTQAEINLLPDEMQLFPNKDSVEGDCHFMLVKYYHESNILFGEPKEAMTELNTFMHGAWH